MLCTSAGMLEKESEVKYASAVEVEVPREQTKTLVAPSAAAQAVSDGQKGIGDVRSAARGSGARYNAGKPAYELIPFHLLEDTARVWEYGKEKYAAWNWAKGMAWTVPYACLLRHAFAWFKGETFDPESGLPHSAHMLCNVLMIVQFEKYYPEGDDRPKGIWS